MTVNVICESELFNLKERLGGIYSAFINHVALLKKKNIKVVVNSMKKADIIHFHSYGPFALFKLLISKEPTVIMIHNVPESFIGSLKGAKFLLKLITSYFQFFYNKVDLLIALNPKTKDDLKKIGITSRIEVLSNPVNDDLFKKDKILREKGRKMFNIDAKKFVVVGVGKQIPRKGIVDFLLIAKKFPDFVFVWSGGKDVDALSPQTKEQKELMENLPENVLFLGPIQYEKMSIIYNMSDVLLFPSFQEIAPMVIIEAAACGLPVILRDLPEYKYLYNPDYIACESIEEFSNSIKKISESKNYYDLSVGMSKRLATKFNGDKIGDKMIDLYKSLINK